MMAIKLNDEKILSLTDATKAIPLIDGKRPHISTLWRWCRKGVRGTTLEYLRVGNRVVTSVEALGRFSQNLADADRSSDVPTTKILTSPKPRTNKRRNKSVQSAKKVLASAGI